MQHLYFPSVMFLAGGLLVMSLAGGPVRDARAQSMAAPSSAEDDAQARRLFVRGMTYAQLDEFDRAIPLYERALKLAPDEAPLLAAMAEAQAAQKEMDTALYYAEQALKAAPSNPAYYTQLADLQEQNGQIAAALDTYRDRIARFPDDVTARLKLARLLAEANRPQEALDQYERIVSDHGGSASMRMEMLRLYREVDDADGIRQTLESLVDERPNTSFFRTLLAEFYTQRGEPQQAIRMYRAVLAANPDNVEAALKLATLYQRQDEPDKAEALLDRALTSDNASTDQLVRRAESLVRRAETDSTAARTAMQLLERALALSPDHAEALNMLGMIHYRDGNYARAADLLQQSVDANPRAPDRWVRTAAAYLQAGAPDRAAAVAEEGLLLFPGQYPLVRVEAYALMESNQNATALQRFEEALDLLPRGDANERARLFAAMGLLYSRQGQHDASDRHYERALDADPDLVLALNNYAYSLAQRGTKLDSALTMAQRAVEQAPDNAAYLDTLGWVYFQRGEVEQAQRWLQKALETGPASATVYEHYGDVHEALGEMETARTYWQKALDRAPDRPSLQRKLDGAQR